MENFQIITVCVLASILLILIVVMFIISRPKREKVEKIVLSEELDFFLSMD